MFKDIIKTLRINHYIKNIVVFIPLLFSKNFYNTDLCIISFYMFISLCLISSAVYILNDIIDADRDKQHQIKCTRPIASGRLPVPVACVIFIVFLILSLLIAFYISSICFETILMYLLLNIIYSLKLKFIALIDVTCIALGFIIRILAGCFAIQVVPSPLVILLTFFISMFFTFSKRKLELKLTTENSSTRESLINIDDNLLSQFVLINAALSVAFYFTYVLDPSTIERAGSSLLYITVIPFTMIIFRLLFLIRNATNDDPVVFFEKDLHLKILLMIYFIILGLVLAYPV